MKKITMVTAGLLAAGLVSGAVAKDDNQIAIDGSTTVGPIAKAFAEYYMKAHPEVKISVSESGSGNGAKGIINGTIDIGTMSRAMKDSEKKSAKDAGQLPIQHVVALDGLAMIVHKANPVKGLTLGQIRKIYAGEIANWKELGGPDTPIVVISRDTNSGTYESFESLALKGAKIVGSAEYVGSNGAVRQRVMSTQNAIGYVGIAFTEEVKVLAVAAVAVVAVYSYLAIDRFHTDRMRDEMRRVALLASRELLAAKSDPAAPATGRFWRELAAAMDCRLTVVAPDGVVAFDSQKDAAAMENHAGRPEVRSALAGGDGVAIRFSETMRERVMYVAVRATPDGTVVRASISLAHMDAMLGGLHRRLVTAGAAVALAAILISILMSRRLGRWLARVRDWIDQYGKGNLDQSLPKARLSELDLLADAVNDMASRLRTQIDALTARSEQEQALLACMIEGVLAVDARRRILRINDSLAEAFGVGPADCTGRNLLDVIRNPDLQAVVDRALASDSPIEETVATVEPERFFRIHAAPLRDNNRTRVGAVLVVHDVTRLRRLETIRQDFVANVSHELKTPITAIKGFAETLADGAAENKEDRDRFIQIILRQSERLHSIVEDLLALAALDAEEENRTAELKPGSIEAVIAAAVQSCARSAAGKGMNLESEVEPIETSMNAPLLEQAVINLLDNAIKYSPAGTAVRVSASRKGDEAVISVTDRGPGIQAVHVPRLFERFYRVDKGRSRNLGGTGLGLAIVKRVALLHGGSVDVKTEPGAGSTFYIRIPIRYR
jgi:two-component system phosphate regulon sensor histidine kinase PhoR